MGATEQLLGADGRRDFAQEEQLEAEKNEAQLLRSIKEAEEEAQRRVKGRNSIVGAPAKNKFGRGAKCPFEEEEKLFGVGYRGYLEAI